LVLRGSFLPLNSDPACLVTFASIEGGVMGKRRHKPNEIAAKLRQVEVPAGQGTPVAEAIPSIGVIVKYYRWRSEYDGMKGDEVKRLKELEADNHRLLRAVSDLTIKKLILKKAARGPEGQRKQNF